MTFKNNAVMTAILCLICCLVKAQTLTYDNETQLFGAAVTFAKSAPLVLEKTVAFCEKIAPSVKEKTDLALKNWMNRHAFFLSTSARYGDAIDKRSVDPSVSKEKRELLKKGFGSDIARMVASKTDSYIEPLRIAKENGTADSMCSAFAIAIDARKFDLKTYDPQLANFFDKSLPPELR